MNLKKLYLSTAVLAVLAAITYFVKNADSSAPADPRVGQTIADNAIFREVAKIRIQGDDESFVLAFDPDRSQWLMQDRHDLPVSMDALGRLRDRLIETRLERLVSTSPERMAEFGFGDRSVALLDEQGDPVLALELGRNTDTGKQLVKFGDESKAFIANDQIALQTAPLAWLQKTLVDFERDDVRRVAFELLNGDSLTVSRDSADEEWSTEDELPADKQLDQGAITRAVNRFASVNFTDLMDPQSDEALAAAENSHHVHIELADDSSYTFRVGRRPEVRVTKEIETENEDGETVTETEEQVETPAGPVRVQIAVSDNDDALNQYMAATAFEAGSFLFTSIPESRDALLADKPEPVAEPAADEPDDATAPAADAAP